ncbi:MAG: hypothetical protein F6K09_25825, partial [Merismopedia sp. SIO2A8]|nr:hypothetical protein [Merismopedia sp. SIO2A8]
MQGKVAYDGGRFTDAVAAWTEATRQSQAQGNSLAEALGLSYLSLAYQSLGQWDEAEGAIAQSMTLIDTQLNAQQRNPDPATATDLQRLHAQSLNAQATLQLAQGQPETAINTWQQAARIYGQLGDDIGVLGSTINQVQVLQSMGLYHQASRLLNSVIASVQAQPSSRLKAVDKVDSVG